MVRKGVDLEKCESMAIGGSVNNKASLFGFSSLTTITPSGGNKPPNVQMYRGLSV